MSAIRCILSVAVTSLAMIGCAGDPRVGEFHGEGTTYVTCPGYLGPSTQALYSFVVSPTSDGYELENASDPCAPYFFDKQENLNSSQCVTITKGAMSYSPSPGSTVQLTFSYERATVVQGQTCTTSFQATGAEVTP